MQYFSDEKIYMNTRVAISGYSEFGTVETLELVQKAYKKFDHVVKRFSRFDNSSDLSKLNNSYKKISLDPEFAFLIKTALDISKISNWKFDPTIIDVLEAYGYSEKKDIKDKNEVLQKIESMKSTRPKVSDIEFDGKAIKLAPGQRLDFGSIGKGYAVDLAAKVLSPIKNFVINAGGDVYASGKNIEKNTKWNVGLSADSETFFGKIELQNQSLASSGSGQIKFKNFHHLINSKALIPETETDQVFTLADSGILADGYATMLFLTGEDGLSILEKKNIGGMIIRKNKILTNKYFPNFLN
ncbi:MAG TPA: FAD:protein FMN transferase [Candidatus Dojkabacteria bacterium]|jgi:thiamine biosynthesis lipoprotein